MRARRSRGADAPRYARTSFPEIARHTMTITRQTLRFTLKCIASGLLLGCMTNVLVIVALAWVESRWPPTPSLAFGSGTWLWPPPTHWQSTKPDMSSIESSFARSRYTDMGVATVQGRQHMYCQMEFAVGFPAYCLVNQYEGENSGSLVPRSGNAGTLAIFHEHPSTVAIFTKTWPNEIPRTIYWPGMLINIATYGTLWALLFAGIAAIRRRRLLKHGLCINCRYDMNGLANGTKCPECGHIPAMMQSEPARAR